MAQRRGAWQLALHTCRSNAAERGNNKTQTRWSVTDGLQFRRWSGFSILLFSSREKSDQKMPEEQTSHFIIIIYTG